MTHSHRAHSLPAAPRPPAPARPAPIATAAPITTAAPVETRLAPVAPAALPAAPPLTPAATAPLAAAQPSSVGLPAHPDQATGLSLRLLICDDHEVFQLGLRALLETVGDLELVARTNDPARALLLSFEVAPDVVLVGQGLADGGELELVRRLDRSGVRVVVLADSRAEEDLVQALRAGARGYLTRRAAPEQLLNGIRAVARHETALDSSVAGHLVSYLGPGTPEPPDAENDAVPCDQPSPTLQLDLTDRQRAVAALVAEGLSNSEIAGRLYLSLATVKSHVTIILRRLGLRDRTQLAILVNRTALLDAPDSLRE